MGRREPGSWYSSAMRTIEAVHASLPTDVSFADRKAAIDAAYPFEWRRYHPYKMWLAARRDYLARYDPKPAGPLLSWENVSSPLDREKRRAQ